MRAKILEGFYYHTIDISYWTFVVFSKIWNDLSVLCALLVQGYIVDLNHHFFWIFSLFCLYLWLLQRWLPQLILLSVACEIFYIFGADWFGWIVCTEGILKLLGWLFWRFCSWRFLSFWWFFTWYRFFMRYNFRDVHPLHLQFNKAEFFLKLRVLLGQLFKQTLVVCLFEIHRFLHIRDCP